MANFIEKTLEPGEEVKFNGRLHWSFNFRYSFWGIVLLLAGIVACVVLKANETEEDEYLVPIFFAILCIIAGLISIIYGYFIRSKTEFAVTTSRFIQKDGIFNIKMTEIPLFKVETVNFYQTFVDRIIGTGSIELVGSGGTNHRVDYVQKPMEVRNLITTLMKNTKRTDPDPANAN